MTSRDAILSRICTALAPQAPPERPPVPEVWPDCQTTVEGMAQRFSEELQTVAGEVIRCASVEEAQQRLAQLLDDLECPTLGALDRPLCRELTAAWPERVTWPPADATAVSLAELKASLVEADYLLADTGTCMIACGSGSDRLLCYLPPVCIVAARSSELREHLPAAWREIAPRAAAADVRGEFVFITGPSRTADIEKILILGVHGPKRLLVLLID